jgi:hypothetical protein
MNPKAVMMANVFSFCIAVVIVYLIATRWAGAFFFH